MSDGFENGHGFEDSRGFREGSDPYLEYTDSIQKDLRQFLSEPEARSVAIRLYNLAQDVDEEIARILKDPMVRKLYDYDGQFFTARNARLFHTTFDGVHLLKSLRDSRLETFFRGREKKFAIELLLDELGKHASVARIRRMNWEETKTLGMLPKDVLDAILENWARAEAAAAGPPRLSAEEQVFFRSFEEQLE